MPPRRLKVAFWNVENLFDPANNVGRGPKDAPELEAKLDRLAACINSFFGEGEPPDLLALAEVNTVDLLNRLGSKLVKGPYRILWEKPGKHDQTGLGVLARDPIVNLEIVDAQRPLASARPRCLILRCALIGDISFVFVVNHWKSQLPSPDGKLASDADRKETALWLRDTLDELEDKCILLIGDFNAEPMEMYFDTLHLPCFRHFSKVILGNSKVFYNTAWRYLAEPFYWEEWASNPKLKEPRPKRTHSGGFVIWDQLMVSAGALKDGPIKLLEKTVRYYISHFNARHNKNGVLEPMRWTDGEVIGASDHFPLLAEFEIL
jgi:exonuclease III